MRLVVDTNVVVSALLWGGIPRQLLDAIHQGRATAFASGELIREFRGVLKSFGDIPILTPAECPERMAA